MTTPISTLAARSWAAHNKARECVVARRKAVRLFVASHPGCSREDIVDGLGLTESQARSAFACVRGVRAEAIYGQGGGRKGTRYWPAEEK